MPHARNAFERIGTFATDISYILSPRYKVPNRRRLLCAYLRLRAKAFVERWVGWKTERFLGFTVTFVNYHLFFLTFRQIFVRQSYYFEPKTDAPTIIDCGGNAGMSVLYFKYMFPKCSITVFEPSASIQPILKKNVEENHLSNVTLEPYAAADKDGEASLYDRGPGSYGSTVLESVFDSAPQKIEKSKKRSAIATKKLSPYVRGTVDLLKLDIEGAEGMVIRELHQASVLGKIDTIVMEYHSCPGVKDNKLGELISIFEKEGRDYQIYLDEIMPEASLLSLDAKENYALIRSAASKQKK